MTILFSTKVFSGVINDFALTRYTDPQLNALLGTAEKYFLEAKASNVAPATDPSLVVTLEISNDGVNWRPMDAAIIDAAIDEGTVLFASDLAGGEPIGRYARYGCRLDAAQYTGAYIELWVTGRDGR